MIDRRHSMLWASETPGAPSKGERVTDARSRAIRVVLYVGRLVWLRCPTSGLILEPIDDFWTRYNRKQLTLPIALLLAAAWLFSGCYAYSGLAVAPNGVVWITTNSQGLGTSAGDVYACTQRGGELQCSKVPVRGLP